MEKAIYYYAIIYIIDIVISTISYFRNFEKQKGLVDNLNNRMKESVKYPVANLEENISALKSINIIEVISAIIGLVWKILGLKTELYIYFIMLLCTFLIGLITKQKTNTGKKIETVMFSSIHISIAVIIIYKGLVL